MTQIQIRTASVEDAEQLIHFNCAMASETENLDLDPQVVAAGVDTLLGSPEKGFYVVADAGGILAGSLMITSEWSDWRNGDFWWIQSVYVRPEHRRRGVYRALYEYVQAMAANRTDICGFRLYVERDNHGAQKTYRSLGMEETRYLIFQSSSPKPGGSHNRL